jgi:uncharacterized membrane protein
MSDVVSRGPAATASSEDRILTTAVYVLYFVAPFFCGITALIGAVVAYVRRPLADGLNRTHYAFQIRTFWIFLVVFVVALIAAIAGLILAIAAPDVEPRGIADFFTDGARHAQAVPGFGIGVRGGALLAVIGGLAMGADVLWLMLASVFGVARLLSGEPIGRLKGA